MGSKRGSTGVETVREQLMNITTEYCVQTGATGFVSCYLSLIVEESLGRKGDPLSSGSKVKREREWGKKKKDKKRFCYFLFAQPKGSISHRLHSEHFWPHTHLFQLLKNPPEEVLSFFWLYPNSQLYIHTT